MQGLKKIISRILLCTMVVLQTLATTGVTTVYAASSLTELESVMVSGGRFDTGIAINQDYSIEISFSLSSLGQYKNLYESSPYILRNEAAKGLYARHGWYNTKVYTPQADENITVLQKKNITYINDKQVLKATYQSITPSTTLKFGDFKGSLKGFRVWNASNVLVGDYVPALDSSNKACMYDKVKKQYIYYTGSCIAGKAIIPNEIEESTEPEETLGTEDTVLEEENSIILPNIEYVDALALSGGTFDSGIKLNQDYSIEITFALSELNQYKNLYTSDVYKLRNEATKGLYARHGWYNTKIYLPQKDEEITLQQKKNIIYINDKQVMKATRQIIEDTSSLTFGNYKGTISSFKIWNENGKLVLDCLPAVDGSDKACMYDTVGKKYIYYSGTCQAVVEEESAEDNIIIDDILSDNIIADNANSSLGNTENSTSTQAVYEILKKALLQADSSMIDVSQYKITADELENVIWKKVIEDNYIEYIAYCRVQLSIYTKNGYASKCQLMNIDSDYANRLPKVRAAINEYLSQIDSRMTDVEKVLLAHEYIIDHTVYKSDGLVSSVAAGPLGEGYGICSAYSEAMIALLHCVDIDAYTVVSSKMNHGWLYVKLDGEYYHIDPTWDDTQKGTNDMYQHRFLLRNDDEFNTIAAARTHYDWYSFQIDNVKCTSQKYTNWYVHDVAGTMHYYDGMWYFVDVETNTIRCANISGSISNVVVDGSSATGMIKIKGIDGNTLYYYVGSKLCSQKI